MTTQTDPQPDALPLTAAQGELHKFLFEGVPVRGMLVKLTGAWQQMLAARRDSGEFPVPVRQLLGQMSAAAILMQANIKFNGALILQMHGDGPLKLAVAEVQPDLGLRATAQIVGIVEASDGLPQLLDRHGGGRCAITLDPKDRLPGQQPYQGVVPLAVHDEAGQRQPLQNLAEVLEHYMRQSEQLDTRLVLAADDRCAAGLLIQRLPGEGGHAGAHEASDEAREAFHHLALLAGTLKAEELLGLPADTILHRLFWEQDIRRFEPLTGELGPRFACTCSRQRVGRMLIGLGQAESEGLIAERGQVEVGCEFCGRQYRFDAIDVAELFRSGSHPEPEAGPTLQ
ncbi:MAG: Hsp33 chaperonin [Pseudomonadota bacterium]|jgi:molecular chaperone Hsp33